MRPLGSTSSRASRLIGWTLGAVALVALLGYLVVHGAMIYLFEVSIPNGRRAKATAEQERTRQSAAERQSALTAAAADGALADDEIGQVVRVPRWDVQRADAAWVVRVEFPGVQPLCFSYEILLPLGPNTRVTTTELPTCPDIRPRS
jgi:hypothetical protein